MNNRKENADEALERGEQQEVNSINLPLLPAEEEIGDLDDRKKPLIERIVRTNRRLQYIPDNSNPQNNGRDQLPTLHDGEQETNANQESVNEGFNPELSLVEAKTFNTNRESFKTQNFDSTSVSPTEKQSILLNKLAFNPSDQKINPHRFVLKPRVYRPSFKIPKPSTASLSSKNEKNNNQGIEDVNALGLRFQNLVSLKDPYAAMNIKGGFNRKAVNLNNESPKAKQNILEESSNDDLKIPAKKQPVQQNFISQPQNNETLYSAFAQLPKKENPLPLGGKKAFKKTKRKISETPNSSPIANKSPNQTPELSPSLCPSPRKRRSQGVKYL